MQNDLQNRNNKWHKHKIEITDPQHRKFAFGPALKAVVCGEFFFFTIFLYLLYLFTIYFYYINIKFTFLSF